MADTEKKDVKKDMVKKSSSKEGLPKDVAKKSTGKDTIAKDNGKTAEKPIVAKPGKIHVGTQLWLMKFIMVSFQNCHRLILNLV